MQKRGCEGERGGGRGVAKFYVGVWICPARFGKSLFLARTILSSNQLVTMIKPDFFLKLPIVDSDNYDKNKQHQGGQYIKCYCHHYG